MSGRIWDKLTHEQKKQLIRHWLRTYPPYVFMDKSIRQKAEELGLDWDEEVFRAKQDRLKKKMEQGET